MILTLFYMISKASVNTGEPHRLFRASSYFSKPLNIKCTSSVKMDDILNFKTNK